MIKRHMLPLFVVLSLLCAVSAFAGWTDTLKQAGSELADRKAKEAGLSYTPSEAASGVREILNSGTEYASNTLSSKGFSADSSTALSLPSWLSGVPGSSSLLSSMNTAASKAAADSESSFLSTIKDMSVTDAASLIGTSAKSTATSSASSSTAVTDYFASQSRDTLKTMIKPIVAKSASAAGVGTSLSALSAAAKAAGTTFDANDYLTDKVLDGMFHYMGVKETSLRKSGGAGASALLQKLL